MAEEQSLAQVNWPVVPSKLEIAERCAPIENKVAEVEQKSAAFTEITTEALAQEALEYVNFISKSEKSIEKRRKDYVEQPNSFVKTLNEIVKSYTGRLETARRTLSNKILTYQQAKEALARAEADKIRKAQEEEALQRAAKLAEAGHTVAADKLLDIAATAPKPKTDVKVRTDTVSSVVTTRWVGEISDKAEILKAAIAGKFPMDAIAIGQAAMNDIAKANQSKEGQAVNGVLVTKQTSLGTR